MAAKPTCLVCHKEMEPGFLTDVGHFNEIHLPRWCRGEPKSSFWSGEANRGQVNAGLKVVAFRCPECEALRLYAPGSDSQD
ncbi:MAG: PF20097 family protein [Phycisphaerales bacterium]